MFTHLHVHSEYSLLDGLSRIEPMVRRTKELGMDSLALTDHGGMYGAIDFYRAAKEAGVKPIIGCEMYVAPGSRRGKAREDKSPYHMTVLAKDATGYQNLIKLVTKSHLEGFYYKPRIDRELLEQHHEGLIVLSGCPSGEVPKRVTEGRIDDARATALWYRDLLGDRYFLELMSHGDVPELPAINKGLIELHRELGIPVVATNDFHYVDKEDASLHDVLLCIQTNTNIHDEKRMRFEEDSYYLKSPEEMEALFADVPEAITNTQRIADMCDLELDFSQLRLPEYKPPDGLTADEYLVQICWDGLRARVQDITPAEQERLDYELDVIRETRFANYFLVVWDIARFVRDRDIFFAVRGSAAASLVLYCLGVTDVDPLKYQLVFERFLNVERKEMPDIDMDFQDDRREEVINYVVSKYGWDHVAQIITFGTMGARASIRDVGRALGMPYEEVDRVARLVPFKLHITLDEALELSPEMAEVYHADESIRKLVDTARNLEGLTRHSSTHAAGVVISKEPLDDVVPLQKSTRGDEEGVAMTQYAMEPVAALGLLKMDFLGLANLTILAKARDVIAENLGVDITLRDIPLNNDKTFELLSRGETVGVFQLEGAGMTRYIKDLKPSSLGDVAAMIALYRPGPMEHIGTFIQAKHGLSDPHYPHPGLEEILRETYGVIVYQDQVLHIFRTFAGYSLGEADIVRKAMGKKIPQIMVKEREKFIQGALRQSYTRELAEKLFALIQPFAGYAFNKAHSVSYALISYWTAYLKANYPAQYMVSLLNSYIDNTEKINAAVEDCRRLQIPVLLPSINKGDADFSIEKVEDGKQAIRFGMAGVKNVGAAALQPVLEARKASGPFTSIEHMCKEADMGGVNRKTVESLIKVGAFDDFGNRRALLEVVGRMLSLAHSEAQLRNSDQSSMFEMLADTVSNPLTKLDIPGIQTSDREKVEWEEELLGASLSNAGLLDNLTKTVGPDTIVYRSKIDLEMGGMKVKIAGQIASATERFTRDQRPFSIATLSLIGGTIEVFVWEDVQKETQGLWVRGKLVSLVGNVRVRDDQASISCLEASEVDVSGDSVSPLDQGMGAIAEEAAHSNGANHVGDSSGPDASPSSVPPRAKTNGANGSSDKQTADQATGATNGATRRLNLRLKETDQPEQDNYLMEDVKRLLLEYRGNDEVNLEIATNGRVVTLEWPLVRVDACAELEQQLGEMLGSSGHVSIQMVMF